MKNKTTPVQIGKVIIGGNNPVIVQSMTNTPTSDIGATTQQVMELANAGAEIVRLTVNDIEAAKSIPKIKEKLTSEGYEKVPLVGCFHYNGHHLLLTIPECAKTLDKYRINPGNVGIGKMRDKNFESFVECAIKYKKPIRIGVNWGSIDEDLKAKMMNSNSKQKEPLPEAQIIQDIMVESAIASTKYAKQIGLSSNKIVISAKASDVKETIAIYRKLAKKCKYSLHLGLTEAGMGSMGIVTSTAALAPLLLEGIGDTIRVSITPALEESRGKEVEICRQILQSLDLRTFYPRVISCPGCGRTNQVDHAKLVAAIKAFVKKSSDKWRTSYPGSESIQIAVMGCVVNGPGESKHANLGISLTGKTEEPIAQVFADGQKIATLNAKKIDDLIPQFKNIINQYVRKIGE